jgi:hypothetical protein
MNINRFTSRLWDWDTVSIEDDFTQTLDTNKWTAQTTDTGTAAVGSEDNGLLTLTPSDASVADNDEVYVASAKALFTFGTNRALYARGRAKFVETASGIYNAFFGFMSSALSAQNLIVDDGGGLRATGSICAIHKIDGETVWRATTRNGSTSTTSTSTKTAGAAYQLLEVMLNDWDGVSMQATFKVDGDFLKDSNGLVIRHTVLIASATIMSLAFGAKLGAITNNDTFIFDKVYAAQTRV